MFPLLEASDAQAHSCVRMLANEDLFLIRDIASVEIEGGGGENELTSAQTKVA